MTGGRTCFSVAKVPGPSSPSDASWIRYSLGALQRMLSTPGFRFRRSIAWWA